MKQIALKTVYSFVWRQRSDLSYFDLFSLIIFHVALRNLLRRWRNNQSAVKFVKHHPTKIDVVKFDGTNNFGIWRCEVIDALMASDLKDASRLEEKLEEAFGKHWDKMNRTTHGVMRYFLT